MFLIAAQFVTSLKGKFNQKMKILSAFTNPYVI